MRKADLVDELAKKLPTKREAAEIVETLFQTIRQALNRDKRITISGFGTFYVKSYHARRVHRLKDRTEMIIPPRKIAKFKPSKKMLQ